MIDILLLIDNYDSFTYNLYQYLGELYDGKIIVRRNDEVTLEEGKKASYIVISPGPGHPNNAEDFGMCSKILTEVSPCIPTLGICLGHQGIATVYGGTVEQSQRILHGKVSRLKHSEKGLFTGVPQGISVARYHSFAVSKISDSLIIEARSDDGEVMAIRHSDFQIYGIQFHPESVLSEYGKKILKNFLDIPSL